ncbi:MAG: hypothetical protein K2N48_02200 [Muribaculaceae bacterium]|nr:hypothetical protein [Muribaculaceae bacterium]
MRKVLLSCVALAAGAAMAIAQDEAVYPSELDFTLNGVKELSGVNVSQTMVPYDGSQCLTIKITGECDADAITMDFTTPEGWDYSLIDSVLDGGNTPFQTRSGDHWLPLSRIQSQYKKGNSFNFPVDGKDNYGTIYLVKGDNFWDISIDIEMQVSKAQGSGTGDDVDVPAFPDHLNYTLNGEKELPGIEVRQLLDETTQVFSVSGECAANTISVTFETPEGWDGLMISDQWGEGEISTVKTRGVELIPVSGILGMGFKEGNTITYNTNGEAQWGDIALIKGDKACVTFIHFDLTVSKSKGNVPDEPGDDEPGDDESNIPAEINVTTFAEGLIVEQEQDAEDGSIYIDVTGAIAEEEYELVLDVPEGWDGFVILPFSENITVGDHNVGPKKIASIEHSWVPIEYMLEEGYIKGNKLTFKATGNWEFAYAYLYKGEEVDENAFISITAKVSQEIYKVSTSCPSLDVTQGDYEGVYTITVTGKCPDDEYTVTIETPEGMDGFLAYSDCNYNPDIEPLKKVNASEWVPVEDLLGDGLIKTNSLTFPADGDEHYGQLIPYKEDEADIANAINIEVLVSKAGDVTEENQKAYDAVIAELDALQAEYESAVEEIKENNPDFDFTEWEEIANMIEQYRGWAAQALASANEDGESFNFAFDGEEIESYIEMMINAAQPTPDAPEVPESYVITSSCPDLNIEQIEDDEILAYEISGECPDDEFTITIEVPEGWDNFIAYSDVDYNYDIMPYVSKKVMPTEWWPLDEMLEEGLRLTNTLTFPADGEEHYAQFMLVKDGFADVMNSININVLVSKSSGTAVESVDSVDGNATYYDMNGGKIAKPAKGIYVKVVDGKATKVVVK